MKILDNTNRLGSSRIPCVFEPFRFSFFFFFFFFAPERLGYFGLDAINSGLRAAALFVSLPLPIYQL